MILLILFFILSSSAFANQCENIDFKEVDMRKEFGPIRDQDTVGNCYAFTGADLVQHYLQKQGHFPNNPKKNLISATGFTMQYQSQISLKSNFDKYLTGIENLSSPDVSLSMLNRRGAIRDRQERIKKSLVIRNDDLSELQNSYLKSKNRREAINNYFKFKDELGRELKQNKEYMSLMKEDEIIAEKLGSVNFKHGGGQNEAIEKIFNSKYICLEEEVNSEDFSIPESTHQTLRYRELMEQLNDLYSSRSDEVKCRGLDAIKELFPNIEPDVIKKVLNDTYSNPIDDLLKLSCKNFRTDSVSKPPKVKNLNVSSRDFTALDTALENGQAVGLSYNSSILVPGDSLGITTTFMKTSNHASVIVGKRINPKTCNEEYILRNSWGAEACKTSYENNQLRKKKSFNDLEYVKSHPYYLDCMEMKGVEEGINHDFCKESIRVTEDFIYPDFSCTDDGYYYIPKERLRNAMTDESKKAYILE